MSWSSAAPAAWGSEEAVVLLNFAGHTFEPLLSGALFWRAESMLLVADLHLEKFSSYAKTGRMLPPYDTGLTLKRLERDLDATGAERVVSLGDSFHRDEGTTTLLDADRLRKAVRKLGGVDAASIRVSTAPQAVSFALDTAKQSIDDAAAALRRGAGGLEIEVVKTIRESSREGNS